MSTLVSKVLSRADRLPIINNATSWFPTAYSNKKEEARAIQQDEDNFNAYRRLTPPGSPRYSMAPPSYEAATTTAQQPPVIVVENKRFTDTLSAIWKRASFSGSTYTATADIKGPITPAIDKKQMEHAVTLINVATDMNNSAGGNQQMAIDLYMMGLDKLMSALPCKLCLHIHQLTLTFFVICSGIGSLCKGIT
jgi:23S rRNA A2030 N6-methylase RlmJ